MFSGKTWLIWNIIRNVLNKLHCEKNKHVILIASILVKIQEEEMDELPLWNETDFQTRIQPHVSLLCTNLSTHYSNWNILLETPLYFQNSCGFSKVIYIKTSHFHKSFNQNKKHRSEIKMNLRETKQDFNKRLNWVWLYLNNLKKKPEGEKKTDRKYSKMLK